MALLKIDLLVDDAGAAQTLANVEQGVQRVGKAAELTAEQLEHVKRQLAQGVDPSKIVLPGEEIAKQATTASAGLQKFSSTAAVVQRDWVAMGQSWQKTGREMSSIGKSMSIGLTAPIVALGGFAIKAAMDFETSFSGVRKTVNATEAQFAALEAGVRNLSKTIPVGVNELNKIMELGGQLGVGPERLLDFTKTIAAFNVAAPSVGLENAAMSIARIAAIMNSEAEHGARAFDVIASSITDLGNNLPVTENEIMRFGLRIAAAGELAGMSEAQVLAIGAAFASVGVQAEAGGTAVQKVLMDMTKSVASDNMGRLGLFGAVAGMSGGEFQSLFKEDAGQAFLLFVEGLGMAGEKAGVILDNLGLKDQRLVRSFLSIATAGGRMRESFELSTAAGQKADAHLKEAEIRYQTTAMQLKLFVNHIVDAGISLGQILIPHLMKMKPAAEAVLAGVVGLVKWFSELPSWMQVAAIGTVGFVAAMGPLLWSFSQLITFGGGVLKLLAGPLGLAGTMTTIGTTAGTAAGGVSTFSVAVSRLVGLLAGPAGLVALLGGAALAYTYFKTSEISAQTDAMKQASELLGRPIGDPKEAAHILAAAQAARSGQAFDLKDAAGKPIAITLDMAEAARRVKEESAAAVERASGALRPDQVGATSLSGFGGFGTTSGKPGENDIQAKLAQISPELAALMSPGAGKPPKKTKEETAAEAAAKKWQADLERLSGREAISAANEWIKKVEEIGGAAKLSAKDLKSYAEALDESLDAMMRLGRVPDQKFWKEWTARQHAIGIAPFATEMSAATLDDARMRADLKAMTESTMGTLGYPGHKGPELMRSSEIPWTNELSDQTININWESINAPGPGFLEQAFGGSQGFGANLSDVMMRALTGGGDLGKSIGGFFGGSLFGEKGLGGMFGEKGISGFIGGALGPLGTMLGSLAGDLFGKLASKLFGIGNAGRDLVKDFAADHGGFDSLQQKLLEMGDAGHELWVKLTQGVGRNNPEQAKKVIEEVGAALDAWPEQRLEAIGMAIGGINTRVAIFGQTLKTVAETHQTQLLDSLRAQGIDPNSEEGKALMIQGTAAGNEQIRVGHQDEFARMGTMAVGGFGLAMLDPNAGAVSALDAMKPTLDVLIPAQQQFNFEASETMQRLMDIAAIVEANRPQFEAIEANGLILRGMIQGNLQDFDLFKAVSSDLGANIQTIIDTGVPLSQALALSQPQLQSLWEAQEQFGWKTDEATQALLDQAATQGIVGPQMKDVNQKILDVLVLIGQALGADIPNALSGLPTAAESAAAGMNDAFSKVRPPVITDLGGMHTELPDGIDLDAPKMHDGGLIGARRMHSGGLLSDEVPFVGQRGEYVVSRRGVAYLDAINRGQTPTSGGGNVTLIFEQDGQQVAKRQIRYLAGEVRRLGLMPH